MLTTHSFAANAASVPSRAPEASTTGAAEARAPSL